MIRTTNLSYITIASTAQPADTAQWIFPLEGVTEVSGEVYFLTECDKSERKVEACLSLLCRRAPRCDAACELVSCMVQQWDGYVSDSLAHLRQRNLLRTLRPVISGLNAVEVCIPTCLPHPVSINSPSDPDLQLCPNVCLISNNTNGHKRSVALLSSTFLAYVCCRCWPLEVLWCPGWQRVGKES